MNIYIASSWRNVYYPEIKKFCELLGHTIMDWREATTAFRWQQLSSIPVKDWDMNYYRQMLHTPRATNGFHNDFSLMRKADCCILLLPCGRSAHLEAGHFIGFGKPLYIFIPEPIEPELMYKFASAICLSPNELERCLGRVTLEKALL